VLLPNGESVPKTICEVEASVVFYRRRHSGRKRADLYCVVHYSRDNDLSSVRNDPHSYGAFLPRERVRPFARRLSLALATFMCASVLLYLFVGLVAARTLFAISLIGHAWRLGLMLSAALSFYPVFGCKGT
jgi:hypothetical protein